ncbi:MAG: VIT1/CCC1 transporter family protein [Candidatus Brocadiia bacterium]
MVDRAVQQALLTAQRNEITEHLIYRKLARCQKDPHNRDVLERIAQDERRHHDQWKEHTGQDVRPDVPRIWFYTLIARLLGLTFSIKLMEKGEDRAQKGYREVADAVPEADSIAADEEEHEQQLLAMVDEERLRYVGSIVLGLNDALVELTGALAGLTFALGKARLIAAAGLITGIAASLSMAASEYLSRKSEESEQDPLKSALYTGAAYVLTVLFLIFPFLLLANPFAALGITLCNALLVILVFTYYVSVARDLAFRPRFLEMAGVSLGVAALSFGIGFVVKQLVGVEG